MPVKLRIYNYVNTYDYLKASFRKSNYGTYSITDIKDVYENSIYRKSPMAI